MKKLLALVVIVFTLSGCNRQIIDITYKYDRAIIDLGTEIIEVEVASWSDYEDGDQLQIKAKNGKTYLVHSSNCTLIAD